MQDDKLLARGEEIARAEMADKDKYQWQWGDWAELVATSRGKGRPRSGTEEESLEYFREKLISKNLEVPTYRQLSDFRRISVAWPENDDRSSFSWTVLYILASQPDRKSLLVKGMTVAKARELVSARKAESTGGTVVGDVVVVDPSILPEVEPEIQEEVPVVPTHFVDPEQLKDPEAARAFVAKHPAVSAALSKAIVQNPDTRRVAAKEFIAQENEVKEKTEKKIRETEPELAENRDWLTLVGHATSALYQLTKIIELTKVVEITESRRNKLRDLQEKIEAASDFIGSWREGGSSSIDQELQDLLRSL